MGFACFFDIDLAQFLLYGDDPVTKTYKVKEGEMINDIALANEISQQEFLLSNPKYRDENSLVAVGTEVLIKQTNPQLKVVVEKFVVEDQINSYKIANQKLDVEIKKIYDESKGRYGSPKITKVLKNKGIIVSQKRVARRMKFLGLRSITIKKFNHAGASKSDGTKEYKNLLEQDFFADKPNKKWVGDITYIYTKETGWTYLAIVMDLFDLSVIGWSYGMNMTDDLVIDAFNKAMINRKLNKDGIFHSDRGSQYTSNDFEQLLEELKIKHSYSKKGYPYDNASMESFNAILKKEEVNVNNYETFNEAKLALFEFIESWYNNKRIHSSLDYITPNEKYNNYTANLALT